MTSAPGSPGAPSPAENLAAVLAAAANGASGMGDPGAEDDDMAAVAAADDLRRAAFDRILATSNDEWASVDNPDALRAALVALLNEVRGPALSTVGSLSQSAAGAAGASAAAANGNGAKAANGANGVALDDGDEIGAIAEAMDADYDERQAEAPEIGPESFRERAKYIPLRLSLDERKMLRLLEGSLVVSQYTDIVDVISYSRLKTKQRIHSQIVDICSILSGLFVASDYQAGQKLLADRDFADNEAFFQEAFEVGRRHKIANPEKMRSTYGKLLYLLQDSASSDISRMLDFSCVKPLLTVSSFLEKMNGLDILDDPLVATATQEIIPHGKTRDAIQKQIALKERAVLILARRYQSADIPADDIRTCLYSIGDNNAFLRCNRDPCKDMLFYLVKYFGPDADLSSGDLAIRAGRGGARLTHNHSRQYQYCLQSLELWREISQHMYKLWYMAESDMLDPENPYSLRSTGQGLQRVQAAPRTARAMFQILSTVQKRVAKYGDGHSGWVGSSVVHCKSSSAKLNCSKLYLVSEVCRVVYMTFY
jgi:Protein of unknown function (DUF2009)